MLTIRIVAALGWLLVASPSLRDPAYASDAQAQEAEQFKAQVLIDEYFAVGSRRYELLSSSYKAWLKNNLQISNARQYEAASQTPERIWRRHVYQQLVLVNPNAMRVSVLVDWEQEGYEGVQTFIFDLIKETGNWRIETIMR